MQGEAESGQQAEQEVGAADVGQLVGQRRAKFVLAPVAPVRGQQHHGTQPAGRGGRPEAGTLPEFHRTAAIYFLP